MGEGAYTCVEFGYWAGEYSLVGEGGYWVVNLMWGTRTLNSMIGMYEGGTY
jgi:hypothetical protein